MAATEGRACELQHVLDDNLIIMKSLARHLKGVAHPWNFDYTSRRNTQNLYGSLQPVTTAYFRYNKVSGCGVTEFPPRQQRVLYSMDIYSQASVYYLACQTNIVLQPTVARRETTYLQTGITLISVVEPCHLCHSIHT